MAPESPFQEPWQAQLHGITVALHEAGAFTWSEWTQALGAQLTAVGADPAGADHYERHAAALVGLLDAKGIAAAEEVRTLTEAWQQAALRTPHGVPIELEEG